MHPFMYIIKSKLYSLSFLRHLFFSSASAILGEDNDDGRQIAVRVRAETDGGRSGSPERRNAMNVKNNRLVQETDERIIRTVYRMMTQEHRPIGKITVREICEQAQIHRSTFYAHYQDVYDLVERVENGMSRQLTETFFRKLDEHASARECFTELFGFIRTHREFYTYYLAESKRGGVLHLAWEIVRERASKVSLTPEQFGARSEAELAYHGAFFVLGITAVVRMWLQNGCREDPAELYDILRRQATVQETMLGW